MQAAEFDGSCQVTRTLSHLKTKGRENRGFFLPLIHIGYCGSVFNLWQALELPHTTEKNRLAYAARYATRCCKCPDPVLQLDDRNAILTVQESSSSSLAATAAISLVAQARACDLRRLALRTCPGS